MNETKGYKNINLSDLGTRQKITQVASRVALFVPRLLGKLATKLIVNPITKLTTGQTYEQVRNEAVEITMEAQKEEASKLDEKIEAGYQNLEDWQEDTEYFIGNLGKYKSYQSTIEDLEKKQTRLLTSPKKLLIGKAYLSVMKKRREERKEQKQVRKMVQSVVNDYMRKRKSIKEKELEIQALEDALKTARDELASMNQGLQQFSAENAEIINQINLDEDYVEVEPEETVVTPEEVSVETPAFRTPNADELTEQELDNVVAGVPAQNTGFRIPTAEDLSQAPVVANPGEQALFNQMANMAAMEQVPTSDASVLESYGLSQEEHQKKL